MKLNEIKELIAALENSTVEEFELERSGLRVRIRKHPGVPSSLAPLAPPTTTEGEGPSVEVKAEEAESVHVFTAPIVGTFYLTPKPDADPFVEVGTIIGKGTVLCIIEAMKIFNQIESDVEGTIARILVDNGQPVEYGEPLFEVQLSS